MKKLYFILTLFFVSLFLTLKINAQQTTPAHANIKIGVISLQELIISMPEAQKADSMLQNFQKELQSTYFDMVKEYQSKDSIFKADSSKLSSTTKDLKKGDLARLAQQIQGFQQTIEEQIQKKQQELLNPIRISAQEAIQKFASKNGYTHILEKGVIYFMQGGDDILDSVKKELKIKKIEPRKK